MSDVIVKMTHARQAKYCAPGMRLYCKRFGLDYLDFVKNGISADKLLKLTNNDALAVKAVEIAKWADQVKA